LLGGLVAHLVTTAAWVVLKDPYWESLFDLPVRVLGWSLFAPYLALGYAVVGGLWLVVASRLRWPLQSIRARLVWILTLPPLFLVAAFLLRVAFTGELEPLAISAIDFFLYFVVAPLSFGMTASLRVPRSSTRG
jgi:hypothetical protein